MPIRQFTLSLDRDAAFPVEQLLELLLAFICEVPVGQIAHNEVAELAPRLRLFGHQGETEQHKKENHISRFRRHLGLHLLRQDQACVIQHKIRRPSTRRCGETKRSAEGGGGGSCQLLRPVLISASKVRSASDLRRLITMVRLRPSKAHGRRRASCGCLPPPRRRSQMAWNGGSSAAGAPSAWFLP